MKSDGLAKASGVDFTEANYDLHQAIRIQAAEFARKVWDEATAGSEGSQVIERDDGKELVAFFGKRLAQETIIDKPEYWMGLGIAVVSDNGQWTYEAGFLSTLMERAFLRAI